MLDQSSVISICSAVAVVVTNVIVTRSGLQNLKEQFMEFKGDIKTHIKTEKSHAMGMADTRIVSIEKDIDEIFPRLRSVEDSVRKNCFAITFVQQMCVRHKKEGD